MNETDFMLVTAHPDDAEFGCAGSVAKWTASGKKVVYLVCTSGDKGSDDPETDPRKLAVLREKEQERAARLLGVEKVVFLRYPDQELEDTQEFRKDIVRQMRIFKPRVVIAMDPYRKYIWHRDHRIVGQSALDAVFPYVRDPLSYPDMIAHGLGPHKVSEIWFFGSEDINHRLDITDTFSTKLEALFCHESQMKVMGKERVVSWVTERCRDMAEGTTFTYAEGFHRVEIPG